TAEVARLVLEKLERPAAEPGDLDTAAKVLRVVAKPDSWPAEVHFVLALQEFYADQADHPGRPGRPGPDLVRKVVQLRRLAETAALAVVRESRAGGGDARVAPYAEQTARWT